jgi:cell division protein FtsB
MVQTSARADAGENRPPATRRRYEGPWIRRGLIFASCALALNALIGERGLAETLRARKQLRQTTIDLFQLKRENAALLERAERLRTDSRAIEGIARGELGLLRKGEILVVVKDVPAR